MVFFKYSPNWVFLNTNNYCGNARVLEEKTRIRNAVVFMASVFQLQRRFLCTSSSKWRVKQVTASIFEETLQELKTHISSSDYVAVSMEDQLSVAAVLASPSTFRHRPDRLLQGPPRRPPLPAPPLCCVPLLRLQLRQTPRSPVSSRHLRCFFVFGKYWVSICFEDNVENLQL